MSKVILLKGLPASGKTTFAFNLLKKNENMVRVNKDDLRAMCYPDFKQKNEKQILTFQDRMIIDALRNDLDVVVDNTNLNPHHETRIRRVAEENGAEFEVDPRFLQVPIEECILRDSKRDKPVGEQVIRKMANQFLFRYEKVVQDPTRPHAIMVDIDGTLAHRNGRSPYDWSRVGEDSVDTNVLDYLLLQKVHNSLAIIVMSGRDSVCRPETEEWLSRVGVQYDLLLMRGQGDQRKDHLIKWELYMNNVRDSYYVRLVLEDRNQVVQLWRQLGLVCFQVADGNF